MTHKRFQGIMTCAIVVFHVFVCVLVIVFWANKGLNAEELLTTLAIVVPFVAVFTTLAIDYAISNMVAKEDTSPKLSFSFMFVASLLPSAFAIALIGVIWMKYRGDLAPAQFTTALGVVESATGVYVGMLLRALFGVKAPALGANAP